MKINVTKDKVSIIEKDIVHAGEYNINHIEFEFSAEYTADLVKNAVFSIKDNVYQTSIINDQCDIPAEILSDFGEVVFGVYAYKVNDDQLELRYSPFPARFTIISGSYDPTAEESEEITPSQFEQYMQALNDGLNKVEESLKKMDEATSSATQLVDNINQKLENGDFIGPEGPQGPQGIPGKDGTNGKDGVDGVGITTITSGQSTVEEDKTITPVTVQKTDGSSQTFNVEAKNGADGKDGLNGKDGVNGQDGIGITTITSGQSTVEEDKTITPITVNKTDGSSESFNVEAKNGADGKDGTNGTDGKDATINGQNTVEITTDNNITLDQQESVLKLGLNSQLIPKNNAEGTDNTFDDGLDMKLYALGGDGKSEQETTDGSQLIDFANPEQKSSATSFSFENGVLNVSSTPGGTYQNIAWNITNIIKSNTGKTLKYKDKTHSVTNENILSIAQLIIRYNDDTPTLYHILCNYRTDGLNSFQIPNDVANIREAVFGVYPNNTVDTNITNSVTVEEPLLYFDNNDSYEPYTGGQPSPSPDYPQEINSIEGSLEFACRGKNLLNNIAISRTVNGVTFTVNEDKTITVNGTATKYANVNLSDPNNKLIPITGNYISGGTNNVRFQIMNAETGSYINLASSNSYGSTSINKSRFNRGYFEIIVTEGTTVNNEVVKPMMTMDALDSAEYEPYVEPNKVTFDLGEEKLRSVGDVKDELVVDLDTGDYFKVENIGEIIFDGSDDEGWYKIGNTKVNRFGIVLNRISGAGVMSNKWIMSNIDVINLNYILDYADNTSIYVNFSDISENDDLATFKSWLSVNKPIVDYLLQNPTTKKLGTLSTEDLAKLKTFKGYNNVTVNTNLGLMNIRFTYGLDIKKYVDNKLAEISAQLIRGE